MLKPLCVAATLSAAALLGACSPTNSNDLFSSSSGGSSSSGSSGSGSATPLYQLGFVDSSGNFHGGQIGLSSPSLSQGGSATVTASIVDVANGDAPYKASVVQFSFDSPCVESKSSTVTSPLNTDTGTVTATYTAQGCSGTDVLTATVQVTSDKALTATAQFTVTASDYVLGYLDAAGSFHPNHLLIGTSPLSAGGTSTIQADLVDQNAGFARYTVTPVTVSFNSPCVDAGTSTIASPVSNKTGSYSTSYTASGCGGNDTVTASATLPSGQSVTATGTVAVQSAVLGQLSLVSVNPNNLGMTGTGGPGTAVVTFKLVDQSNTPLAGQTVHFTLVGAAPGTSLGTGQGVTATDGTVRATVVAGSQHSIVSVVASVSDGATGGSLQTQSTPITISTGVPTSSNVSVAIGTDGCPNIEMLNFDGVNTVLQVRATDRYKFPVPDGTSIFFKTESGSVTPSCATVNGTCNATFSSQNPRPDGSDGGIAGRSVVLAYAPGEEAFTDENGSGLFQAGDPFSDISELFLDFNENGIHDTFEPFVDYNANGKFDAADGKFTGLLCSDSTICSSTSQPGNQLNVGQSVVLVWSGSEAQLAQVQTDMPAGASYSKGVFTFPANTATGAQVAFVIVDDNGQPLPVGTSVALGGSGLATVAAPASLATPCTGSDTVATNAYPFSFTIPVSLSGTQGSLSLSVKTPKSSQAQTFAFGINIQ